MEEGRITGEEGMEARLSHTARPRSAPISDAEPEPACVNPSKTFEAPPGNPGGASFQHQDVPSSESRRLRPGEGGSGIDRTPGCQVSLRTVSRRRRGDR